MKRKTIDLEINEPDDRYNNSNINLITKARVKIQYSNEQKE